MNAVLFVVLVGPAIFASTELRRRRGDGSVRVGSSFMVVRFLFSSRTRAQAFEAKRLWGQRTCAVVEYWDLRVPVKLFEELNTVNRFSFAITNSRTPVNSCRNVELRSRMRTRTGE